MNEGTLAYKLRSAGVAVYVLDERKVASPRILARLCAILRTWRPDVIHTHREKENILGSLASRLCWNVPRFAPSTVDGRIQGSTGWKGARRRAVRALDRWCGRALQQRVIAVTRELSVRVKGEFPAEKIVVIENGVDVEAVRAEKGIAEFRAAEPDATHVGIVGRLADVKRVDLFLEAAAALLGNVRSAVGDSTSLVTVPSVLELEGALRATADIGQGHVPRSSAGYCRHVSRGLDALVICSDHEGLPMTALEAAALAVPTVAHAVGGLVEVVPQEFLVARHEVDGYKDGILRALRADGRVIAEKRASATLQRFSAQRNAERVQRCTSM